MEIGALTFADIAPGASAQQRMQDLIEEIKLADEVGLDVFGVGEHHRTDYAVSAPAVALAAAAAVTQNIRLSSAVTVLSSDDPVRVFQDFATVDLISNGRAEIMAGRGSFTESFPLFGYDLDDYDELYAEKLELLLALRSGEPVTWRGKHRAPLENVVVYPRPVQDPLPVWVAVGGSPQSVARAGLLGLPLTLAIIGGDPERFVPFANLYREALEHGGHPADTPLAINQHTFIASDSKVAADTFFPPYSEVMSRIGRERGWSPLTRMQFENGRGPRGHLLVGDPEQVAEKILRVHELFDNQRFMTHMSVGTVDHAAVMRSIELLGTEVAPLVREEVARRETPAPV